MNRNVPEIRFGEFEGEWETDILGKVCNIVMGQSPDGSTYSDTPTDYILVQGNADIKNGWVTPRVWTTQKTKIANAGDLIMSVRAPAGAMGKTAFDVVLGRGVAGIKGNEFLYQSLVKMNADGYWKKISTGSTFDSINSDVLVNTEISIPTLTEQEKIGDFFSHLDSLITIITDRHEKLLALKKAMLQKMFPQEGESVPRIRFGEFGGEWELKEFGDIVTKFDNPVSTPTEGYTRLGVRSFAKGTFHTYVPAGQELSAAQMHCVMSDKFIVNITFAWEHAVAITDKNDEGKLVSHRFPQFSFDEGNIPNFFKYVITDEHFKYHLWLSSPGGAGRNKVLDINEMLTYKLRVPNSHEQQKIGEYFDTLENAITAQEQKIEKLKQMKAALMQKMFI